MRLAGGQLDLARSSHKSASPWEAMLGADLRLTFTMIEFLLPKKVFVVAKISFSENSFLYFFFLFLNLIERIFNWRKEEEPRILLSAPGPFRFNWVLVVGVGPRGFWNLGFGARA